MLINRDYVIKVLLTAFTEHERNEEYMMPVAKVKQEIADIVSELPTSLPKGTDVADLPSGVYRPQGKWIDHSEDGYVECPFCDAATNCDGNIEELHYCWNCGAKMRGEE